jgi:hypothetical protein
MGNRSNVFDHGYFQSGSLQGTDRSFTTGTGALDHNLDRLQTMFHRSPSGGLCCHLSSIGSILSGTAESKATSTGPGKSISGSIG